MLAKVTQTKSNGENLFEISNSSGVLFYAKAPWMNLNLPFNIDNMRNIFMTNRNGEVVYKSSYSVVENAIESALPFKYFWGQSTKISKYSILAGDEVRGSFYNRQDGIWDTKLIIECNGRIIWGAEVSTGKFKTISLYVEDHQIGQITKPLIVTNNLDKYYIHLLDEAIDLLPILSFFVVYYDYLKFNNSGEFVKYKKEIKREYTYNKNNRFYNPNWLMENFLPEEAEIINEDWVAQPPRKVNKMKIIVPVVLGVSLTTVAIILLVFMIGSKIVKYLQKEPVSAEEFTDIVEDLDYDIVKYDDEDCVYACNDDCEVWFYTYEDVEEAKDDFHEIQEELEDLIENSYSCTETMNSYQLKTDGCLYYVCQVDDTLVIWASDAESDDELKELRKELGY